MSLTGINLFVCLVGVWICICRLNEMNKKDTVLVARQFYVVFTMLFISSGISFLWEIEASFLQLAQSGSILAYLIWDRRRGQPPTAEHFEFYEIPYVDTTDTVLRQKD